MLSAQKRNRGLFDGRFGDSGFDNGTRMAKRFFPEDWEKLSKEELITARARLSGFIESTTEKEKTIRDVSIATSCKHGKLLDHRNNRRCLLFRCQSVEIGGH